jgi:putative membrane protein
MMFWYGSHVVFWQAGLMWLGMIAFWALLFWGVFAVVNESTRRTSERPPAARDAQQILDERLAKGEIDVEEYRRLRDAMGADNDKSPVGSER